MVTLAPEIESEILGAVNAGEGANYVPVPPERAGAIAEATARAVQPLILGGQEPVVLTSAPVRRFFRRIVEQRIPKIVVLSYSEIDPAVQLESSGVVQAAAEANA